MLISTYENWFTAPSAKGWDFANNAAFFKHKHSYETYDGMRYDAKNILHKAIDCGDRLWAQFHVLDTSLVLSHN